MEMYDPPHPGGILKEALENVPTTVTAFAAYLGVSRVNLSRVLNCRAGITPEMSIRIGQAFGQSSDIWFKMQNAYDFWQASQLKRKKIKPLKIAA
jgi:addiction module HigA family antidote